MIVNRIEDNSDHTFYNSPIGVSDWIVRSGENRAELQITSAYQNYSFLALLKSDNPFRMAFSRDRTDYSESRENSGSGRFIHTLKSSFSIALERSAVIAFPDVFLESSRSVRIFQEGGPEEYRKYLKHSGVRKARFTVAQDTLKIVRRYNEHLEYCVKIVIPEGGWKFLRDGKVTLALSGGNHELVIEMSIDGKWPDEDLSPFSDDILQLLSCRALRQFGTLDSPVRREMEKQLEALMLLSRKNKLLAGGPRFFTYFGRDSLISISLLSGIVIPELTIKGLKSVLTRLSADGEVAHEETLGEYARVMTGRSGDVIPEALLEYHMVDDDFLLPAVIRHWLELENREILMEMLSQPVQATRTGYELLAANLEYCAKKIREGLIPYHQGIPVGDWRDSLAFQRIRYSYELNRGLVPGFPDVYEYLLSCLPELKKYHGSTADGKTLLEAHGFFMEEAKRFEAIRYPREEREAILEWLEKAGFTDEEGQVLKKRFEASVTGLESYRFFALGLREDRSPIDVQHNDTAFNLLYGNPGEEEISIMIGPFETPFPLGLRTDVGILVSNPLFCDDPRVRAELNRSHYHGLVIWPLMHNLLYHGLMRQLGRFKEGQSHELVERMKKLIEYLDDLDSLLSGFSASELFTFSPREDGDVPLAFGASTGSTTESNPIQLWSSLGFTRKLMDMHR